MWKVAPRLSAHVYQRRPHRCPARPNPFALLREIGRLTEVQQTVMRQENLNRLPLNFQNRNQAPRPRWLPPSDSAGTRREAPRSQQWRGLFHEPKNFSIHQSETRNETDRGKDYLATLREAVCRSRWLCRLNSLILNAWRQKRIRWAQFCSTLRGAAAGSDGQ